MKHLIFLHGLEGSSKGTKAVFLKKHFPACLTPDFTEDMHQRIDQLKALVKSPVWLVGSSMGGLQALFFANYYPDLVRGMVLVAPAVGFFEDSWCSVAELKKIQALIIPENIPCTILAGINDTIIPMAEIEALVERSPKSTLVRLLKKDDDHQLNQSLETLLKEIKLMTSA